MTEILPAPTEGPPVFKGTEWHEHVETARALIESIDSHRWGMAAICASVETKFGEASMSRFASEIGWSRSTVYAYAQTHRAFTDSKRSEILGFTHHAIAARSDDPEAAIEEAELEELSTREMEERVQKKAKTQTIERCCCPECGYIFALAAADRWMEEQ